MQIKLISLTTVEHQDSTETNSNSEMAHWLQMIPALKLAEQPT